MVQVIGNVIDVEFANGQLPAIFNALRVVDEGKLSSAHVDVTVEVQQHLGETAFARWRCSRRTDSYAA